ncbi:golgin subfamily A member 4-like isoform X2 [Mya arenaria]|uniref:golgin subfamily A member 4-like isoform X2 n=1 Tax=Mya arenaria TaxID=6604 RepID=UPI0022E5689A|nr:golgin subfamily A member 4-like isoform X2 [Mya arenaria]
MSGNVRKSTKNTRPLGAIRQPIQTFDRVGRIPAFNYNKTIHHDIELQGNAMQVPPPKEEPEREVKTPVKPIIKSGKSDSGSSTKSQKDENLVDKKELLDAKPCSQCKTHMSRIKELRQQITSLEKEIEELKETIQQRDVTIEDLKRQNEEMEAKYKKMYEGEVSSHKVTKTTLESTRKQVSDLEAEIARLLKEQQEKLEQLNKQFDQKLAEMTEQKDKEIADRDSKLNRLKQQMAESLKGNSWERQQQLEELTKELGRIQDEADTLRMKLRQYKNNKTCTNCNDMASKLERAVVSIKEKDASIKELNSLCSKFETQLKKQDEILKMFADKKGHKIGTFPK